MCPAERPATTPNSAPATPNTPPGYAASATPASTLSSTEDTEADRATPRARKATREVEHQGVTAAAIPYLGPVSIDIKNHRRPEKGQSLELDGPSRWHRTIALQQLDGIAEGSHSYLFG